MSDRYGFGFGNEFIWIIILIIIFCCFCGGFGGYGVERQIKISKN